MYILSERTKNYCKKHNKMKKEKNPNVEQLTEHKCNVCKTIKPIAQFYSKTSIRLCKNCKECRKKVRNYQLKQKTIS